MGLKVSAPSLRTDLEKAIAAHGGQGVVAAALGWPLKARHRRPKGYWDDLSNVRQAIDEFIGEQGMEAGESAWAACKAAAVVHRGCCSTASPMVHAPSHAAPAATLRPPAPERRDVFVVWVRQQGGATLLSLTYVMSPPAAGVMPLKNDFVRANRLYLAKVVERWGGLPQLAEVCTPP
jgi:hypothetical protein